MTCQCILGHRYAHWHAIQEIPVWQTEHSVTKVKTALGNQPQERRQYSTRQGLIERVEPDLNYVLVGKVLEQRRVCADCGYTQIDTQRWKV